MEKLLLALSGYSPLFSFLLLLAAAFPLLPLLTKLLLLLRKKKYQKNPNNHFIQYCLCALHLFACLILGYFSLQAPQTFVQFALHLGGIFGLVLGLIYYALLRRWGEYLGWGLLFPLPLYLVGLFRKQLELPLWPLGLQLGVTLIDAGYAFLVAWQTHSALIAFWSTLIAALILPLVVCNFFLLTDFTVRLLESRLSSLSRQINAVLSWWTAPVFIRSNRSASPRLANYIEDVPALCLLSMSMLPSLLILALFGGLVGSFLL